MTRLLFFFLGLAFTISTLDAQETFSQKDLKAFAEVYMANKRPAFNQGQGILPLLEKHNISRERYGEIFRAHHENKSIPMSKSEKSFLQELQTAGGDQEKKLMDNLKRLCKQEGLSYETFKKIDVKFQSDIAFQRSLKPQFDSVIRSNKNE
ncbi:MAG: hypothetical protein HKN16_07005 [Saprospiraceae bacterium]|nr:hypothetical protein [Saprospiraceae bacterium]